MREWDDAQEFPAALRAKLADLGLMGIQFAPRVRRLGMSRWTIAWPSKSWPESIRACRSRLRRKRARRRAYRHVPGAPIRSAQFLTPLARGEKLAAWALTEPSSGSDAAAMRTTAARDGDVGDQRQQSVHHPRHVRRDAGRYGRDRQEPRQQGHFSDHRRTRGARTSGWKERRQAWDARERNDRGDFPELLRARRLS